MKKYLVEFICTFFLVFIIGTSVIEPGAGELAPLCIGIGLIALVYAGGHISKAHYNPAVTISLWLRGWCDKTDVFPYILAQVLGSILAALIVGITKPAMPAEPSVYATVPALLVEVLFTFLLMYVILNVATAKATAGNGYYGIAIGGTVMCGIYAVGPTSGALFNPAVAVATCMMGLTVWGSLWIYLLATFSGALLALVAFNLVKSDED